MCELFGMSSTAPATVTCGLRELARHSAAGPHRDGWGVAFHQGAKAQVFRGAEPADESVAARRLAEEGYPSRLVVAHIRHATQGVVALRNTQPLSRELGRQTHLFAHNGDLVGVERLLEARGGRHRPVGETDSERAFCLLLDQLEPLWRGAMLPPPLEERFERLLELAARLRPLGPANFLYTDGDALFAHGHRRRQGKDGPIRPPGLHVLTRQCADEADDFSAAGVRISAQASCAVLFASVPLSDEPWAPLAEGELVVVRAGRIVARSR